MGSWRRSAGRWYRTRRRNDLEGNAKRMMTMTMRVKFAEGSSEEEFRDISWKPLNLKARGNVLEDRTRNYREVGALEVWADDLQTERLPAAGLPVSQRPVEQDALSEMLEEMSLSTLLYYVLVGEGTNTDESA